MLRPGSWRGVPPDGCPRERGGVTSPAQHATMWCVDQPVSELEEVTPMLLIVGGMDIHRKQVTFDYLDLVTGEVKCGQIAPADRAGLRAWLERFGGVAGVAFAVEACTGWRYVAEEIQRAGIEVHLAEPAAGVLEPAAADPGVPGAAGDLSRSAARAHRLGPARPRGPVPPGRAGVP